MSDSSKQPGRPLDPTQLTIPPGQSHLARQIGIFPAFRAALLEDASGELGLAGAGWRGRDVEDFGTMLLELWAYCADVLSFYDGFIAGESYLRTARRLAAVRKLVNLIGYIPQPAVAAQVDLALVLSGRLPVTIPVGATFRSASFDAEKPQVFTVMEEAVLHPLASKFTLQPTPRAAFGGGTHYVTSLMFQRGSVGVKPGEAVAVFAGSAKTGATVASVEDASDDAGNPLTKVTFNSTIRIPGGTPYASVRLKRSTGRANVWSNNSIAGNLKWISTQSSTYVRLESMNKNIKVNDYILVRKGDDVRWFKVSSIGESQMTIAAATTTTITGDSDYTVTSPAVKTPVTKVYFGVGINNNAHSAQEYDSATWTPSDGYAITVYFGLVDAGVGAGEASAGINANDVLKVEGKVPTIPDDYRPTRYILKDLDETAYSVDATLADNGVLTVASTSKWQGNLTPPVTAYGALARATRGEAVNGELLGMGNASLSNQTFKLKKKPLTYLSSTTDAGVVSTLEIYVDGVKWREVPRFYGRDPDEAIFIVRQDDEGNSIVTFGDGVRGARPVTGSTIVGSYFFGAGKVAPPARTITQMVKPVKGVTTVTNPLPAFGGEDGEGETNMQTYAPRSALMLGRAVSLVDYEAVAMLSTGVRSARAEWRWSGVQQRPVVKIWYIGEGELGALIQERLQNVSAEGVPFEVDDAVVIQHDLSVGVVIDADYIPENVLAEVTAVLADALMPETLGIGAVLFRSRVLALAAGVAGVIAPTELTMDGQILDAAGLKAGTGKYFEFTVSATDQTS